MRAPGNNNCSTLLQIVSETFLRSFVECSQKVCKPNGLLHRLHVSAVCVIGISSAGEVLCHGCSPAAVATKSLCGLEANLSTDFKVAECATTARCYCTVLLHGVTARCYCTVLLHGVTARCYCTVLSRCCCFVLEFAPPPPPTPPPSQFLSGHSKADSADHDAPSCLKLPLQYKSRKF